MYSLDKLEVVNCIAPECRGKWHGEILELLQVLSKVNVGYVVDDIQEGYTGTCVARRLALDWKWSVNIPKGKKSCSFLLH
jgi:hypothetical protein